MMLPASIDTVVVGAGQAGLAMSGFLGTAGVDHLVLERRDRPGGSWLERWDAFRLVTPNWCTSLPGYPYDGDDPDGFMSRSEIARRVADYAQVVRAPVRTATEVRRLSTAGAAGLRLETHDGPIDARRVVVATGTYHAPRIPPLAGRLSGRVAQLHAGSYRSEAGLPPGGVLVVGSGQSGVQIAEELHAAARPVFLAVGSAGWAPRRYRGRDIFGWLVELARHGGEHGVHLPTVEELPDPRARLAPAPQLTGHGGGHDVDLRAMAAAGMTLLGHVEAAEGERLRLRPDLGATLDRSERFFGQQLQPMIEAYLERTGSDAPPQPPRPVLATPESPTELDLRRAGISTVIWATGYRPDFGWIDLPIFDAQGFPRQDRGITAVPGLSFMGLHWQHTMASATLLGPSIDGPYLATRLGLTSPADLTPANV